MNNIPPNFGNYLNPDYYEPAISEGGPLYTEEMLTQIQQIVACIPGDNTDIDVSKLPPKELAAILKGRLDSFRSSLKIEKFNLDYFEFWEKFIKILRSLEVLVSLNDFEVLRDAILEWTCSIDENNRFAIHYDNPKSVLEDLKLLQVIRHIQDTGGFGLEWSWRKEINQKLIYFRDRILDRLRDDTPHARSTVYINEAWTPEHYEVMSDILEFVEKCDEYCDQRELELKFAFIILSTVLLSHTVEFRGKEPVDRTIHLDSNAFKATTQNSLVRVLEKFWNTYIPFYDEGCLPILNQFQKIMNESSVEVRKIYHRLKVNLLTKFYETYTNGIFSLKGVMNTLEICVREMADNGDKEGQYEIDPILVRILERKRPVLKKISEQVGQDLEKFADTCISLLKIDTLKEYDVVSNYFNFTKISPFNEIIANSICSRASVWSERGRSLIWAIQDPDVQIFAQEFQIYKSIFEKLGMPDKSIIVKGEKIHYHSWMVPEYVMKEIQNDESISTKGVKAILFGFYCGWKEDSALFKYWKKDWVHVVKQLHPEVAEDPALFFKHFFSEDLDEQYQEFFQNIKRDFGPADVSLKIQGQSIPVHRELLKGYCDLLPRNFFSARFSGIYKQGSVIDLDHPSLTYRGVCLVMMMDIYKEIGGYPGAIMDSPAYKTFFDEWKSACDFFEIDPLTPITVEQRNEYNKLMLEIRLRYLLDTTLSTDSSIAQALADLYARFSTGKLVPMCQEAFRVANEKSIPIADTLESLIEQVQQLAYAKLDKMTISEYSLEERFLFNKYKIEHFEEGELRSYFDLLNRTVVFPVGEKGKAFCRKEALSYMEDKLTSEGEITYQDFNKHLKELIFFLSFADVQELTPEEFQIVHDMVNALPRKLPKLMLVGEMIDLKNEIMKQWEELNKRMGTKIPFVIDFTPQ